MNFLIRTHSAADSYASSKWFDEKVRWVLHALAGGPFPTDSIHQQIAQLPARLGGLGLRSTEEIAPFAAVSRLKGEQHAHQVKLDEARLQKVERNLTGQQKAWLNSGAIANQPITHEECILGNPAFRLWIRQRLLLRACAENTICACGQDANNMHVLTCPRLVGNPKIFRHDSVVRRLGATLLDVVGGCVTFEPSAGGLNKARPDAILTLPVGTFATDVTIATPGSLSVANESTLAAASVALKRKQQQW